MKNIRKNRSEPPEPKKPAQVQQSQQVTAETEPENIPEKDEEIERIAFPVVKKTGLPAWDRMRKPAEAEATLRRVATDPRIAGGGGSAETQALAPLCAQAVLLLGVIAHSTAKKAGYTNPEVMLVDQNEAVPIGELAVRVLQKYSATMKYAEEWMLGAAVLGLFGAKYAQLEKTPKPQQAAA
jgi:hypothetical protein